MFQLPNKYFLLKFLNKKHSLFERILYGSFCFFTSLIFTRSFNLAKNLFDLSYNDHFKTCFRRIVKYFQIYTKLKIYPDNSFNLAIDLELKNLLLLENKISKLLIRNPSDKFLLQELLNILSEKIKLSNDSYIADKQKFETIANTIISSALESLHEDINKSNVKSISSQIKINSFEEDANEALKDFAEVFPSSSWKWFVASGTFLGLIREKGFLKHDFDLDLGFMSEEFQLEKFIQKIKKSTNFFVKKVDYQIEYSFSKHSCKVIRRNLALVNIIHTNRLNIDIFIFYANNNNLWHGSTFHRWNNSKFDLKKYKLCNIDVLGPANPEIYLTENYGDWRTPVKEFDFTTGTPNLAIVDNPSSIALFLIKISRSNSGKYINRNIEILKNSGYINKEMKFKLIN